MKFPLLKALDEVGLVEHRGAALLVKPRDVLHPHSQRKTSGDDCACARAGNVVEIISKHEVVAASEFLFKLTLDFSENFERDYAANTTTVECKKFSGTGFGKLVFERRGGLVHSRRMEKSAAHVNTYDPPCSDDALW